jgi:hypothetical protein
MVTIPKTKWERQLTPCRIMGDLNWVDLSAKGDWRTTVAISDDGRLYCLKGNGGEKFMGARGSPAPLVSANRMRSGHSNPSAMLAEPGLNATIQFNRLEILIGQLQQKKLA